VSIRSVSKKIKKLISRKDIPKLKADIKSKKIRFKLKSVPSTPKYKVKKKKEKKVEIPKEPDDFDSSAEMDDYRNMMKDEIMENARPLISDDEDTYSMAED
jgi:hypothetical protein